MKDPVDAAIKMVSNIRSQIDSTTTHQESALLLAYAIGPFIPSIAMGLYEM